MVNFIIDDGVPDRGHRKAIFNTKWRLSGVAECPFGTAANNRMTDILYSVKFKMN